MYKIILILSISILITNHANAQQTINSNVKHDWEDSRYTVNANNTVTDNKTNLIWKRCPEGLSGKGCTTDTATKHNFQDTLDLANDSTYAGFVDWRLPTINELKSIAAYDRNNPAINSAVFPNTPSNWFWSSSREDDNSNYASILHFYSGNDDGNFRYGYYYIRLVRGGQ